MSGQFNKLEALFQQRMAVISALSQANADCLRALQMHAGNDILLMTQSPGQTVVTAQNETNAEIEACNARIEALEADLSQIDLKIENIAKEED